MKTLFDMRHRWEDPVWSGARFSRTCRVCGRIDTAEVLVPNALLDAIFRNAIQPNPYRALFR